MRHLLLIITAVGAGVSLALALELYRREQSAEISYALNNRDAAAKILLQSSALQVLGLFSIAVLFLALLLLLMALFRENNQTVARRDSAGEAVVENSRAAPLASWTEPGALPPAEGEKPPAP